MGYLLGSPGVLTQWHPTGHSRTLVKAQADTVMHRSGFVGFRALLPLVYTALT